MELALVAGLLGVGLGLARGGSLEALSRIRLAAVPMLIAGVLIQAAALFEQAPWAENRPVVIGGLLLSYALVLVFVVLNRRHLGLLIAGVGVVANLLVISLNGAMPVSLDAVGKSDADTRTEISDDAKHELLDGETAVAPLSDVIRLPWPRIVVSVGDLLLALGIGVLGYSATTAPLPPPRPE